MTKCKIQQELMHRHFDINNVGHSQAFSGNQMRGQMPKRKQCSMLVWKRKIRTDAWQKSLLPVLIAETGTQTEYRRVCKV